jgi:DNA primase catalytic core
MARIPDDQLDRLKTEISLQRLAEGVGMTLKRHGADLIGLCPFHDDKEPSLVISPKNNLWHCLGACQCGGSVIDWVMKAEGVSFRHAVELLQADYQPLAADPVKRSTVQKLPTTLESSTEDARLLAQVIDYYHEALKQAPEALAYLEKRGIANAEAIGRFKLGFANRTLGYRLPEKNRKEGAAIRGQLQRLGLYRASGHEHFTGSIVIPVIDERGQVLEVYGRKINDNLRKGTPLHLYLPGPHRGIWNAEALQAVSEMILCESLIDALTFWCAGFRNVTASYGIEGFTADHLDAFKAHGTERVLIAYDRDAAGETAAEKLSKKLIAEGLDCYRIHVPKGMDVNEYACQVTPAAKSLGVVIRSAVWLGKGNAKPVTTEAVNGESRTRTVPVPEPQTPLLEPDAESDSEPEPEPESIIPLAAKEESADPLPAAVVPESPKSDIKADVKDNEIVIALGDRRYRIRGLEKNLAYDVMKVNLLVSAAAFDGAGESIHVDTFDLYQQRPRGAFIKQAAVELGVKEDVVKADLGKLLLKCEALQSANIEAAQAPKNNAVTLDDEETKAALDLLKSPDLLARIQNDFTRCGVVGEDTNKLVGYLAVVSRKLDSPLAVTIQSTSAAGKSSLMDAVLAFMPDEDRIKYSAMTGQSLFYMGETDLQHKVLAIVEEEGASNAAYALKLLQSEGELTIASTGKDPVTGELKTQDYQVKGPVMIMLTTTAIDIDEELLNRCIVLSIDEGRDQTKAIHAIQRDKRTLAGLMAKADKASILTLHQNAQRLLQPLAVMNPYARHLTFVDDRTRTRRDHEKYLTLIDTLALLHQHQRPIKTVQHNGQAIRYVEVTLDDIETANRLAHEALGRTLDELPPQTRKLLRLIVELVTDRCEAQAINRSDYRFSRRDIREHTNWSDTALKVHLARLAEMEYLLVHRGGRGQSYVYELLYQGEGEQGESFLMGLIDVAALREKQAYDEKKSGQNANWSGSGRPPVRGQSGGSQGSKNGGRATDTKAFGDLHGEDAEKALLRPKRGNGSYDGQEVLVSRAQGCAGATRNPGPALSAKAAD